jgi:hypothetical protein
MYALVQTARHASWQESQAELGSFMTQGQSISDQTARHMAKRWADTNLHGAVGSLIALASNQSFDTDELREEVYATFQDTEEQEAFIDWLDNLEALLSTD